MRIPFALVGAGAMGLGLLHQALAHHRFTVVAVHDTSASALDRARALLADADQSAGITWSVTPEPFLAASSNAAFLVDASSAVSATRPLIDHFLDTRRHVFMMNSEADLAWGPRFLEKATGAGVLYSSVDGDQHAVIKRLADQVRAWGVRPVMLGNIKGFLDRRATPTSVANEARLRDLDPVMCCSYTDGTKLAIEMALLANGTGAQLLAPGMLGPHLSQATDVLAAFDFERAWDGHTPVVDYILGSQPDGGVFVVGYSDDLYQRKMLKYYKLGDGPYYVFVRPFHLCHLETLPAIAEGLATNRALLAPWHGRRTDAYAFAKRPLRAGDTLDGIGGTTCYGLLHACESEASAWLPVCESDRLRLLHDLPQDAPIPRASVIATDAG